MGGWVGGWARKMEENEAGIGMSYCRLGVRVGGGEGGGWNELLYVGGGWVGGRVGWE